MKSPRLGDLTHRNVERIATMESETEKRRTFGERLADFVAMWVGSWTFLILLTTLFAIWIMINILAWLGTWDPYPFVLLNLFLSFQAAFATPIILMSQNRQALLSQRRNHLDLQINLLAEQENTEQLRLLRLLCQQLGVSVERPETTALEQNTSPSDIIRQIKDHVEPRNGHTGTRRNTPL